MQLARQHYCSTGRMVAAVITVTWYHYTERQSGGHERGELKCLLELGKQE
jgi:hypothetical protein